LKTNKKGVKRKKEQQQKEVEHTGLTAPTKEKKAQ